MSRRDRRRALDRERERAVIADLRRAAARRHWAEQTEREGAQLAARYAYVPPAPPLIPEPPFLLSRRLEAPSAVGDDPDNTQELPLLGPSPRERGWNDTVRAGPDLRAGPGQPRHHAPGSWDGELPARTDRTLTALLAAFMVVVLGAIGATAWFLLPLRGAPSGPVAVRTQQTLLLLLTDDQAGVTGAALLGTDGTTASALMLPSRMRVQVAGRAVAPLGKALPASAVTPGQAPSGAVGVGRALSDALGVRVDGTWVLSRSGLASLVDSLGGIKADLGGAQAQLNGRQAASGPEDPDRLGAVVCGLLAGLDGDRAVLAAQVSALGLQTSTTMPAQQLTGVLLALHAATSSTGLTAATVPVLDGFAAGPVDRRRADRLVERLLPGARLPASGLGVIQVMVRNAVGVPGLNEVAKARLQRSGLRYSSGGNAGTFGRRSTQVLVPGRSAVDMDRGRRVAEALGVPATAVRSDPAPAASTTGYVLVLLGADFAARTDEALPAVASASSPVG